MATFPWLGFTLQAPQALYTVTGDLRRAYARYRGATEAEIRDIRGYGLVLGGIAGAIADAFWTGYRIDQGKRVTVIGPPPDDLLGKAYRYMLQPQMQYFYRQALSLEDHQLLMAADAIALNEIRGSYPAALLDQRASAAHTAEIPVIEPWNPTTLDVLLELGWDAADEPSTPIAGMDPNSTYGDLHQILSTEWPFWQEDFYTKNEYNSKQLALTIATANATELMFTWLLDGPDALEHLFSIEEMELARLFELRIFPIYNPTPDHALEYIRRLLQIMAAVGEDTASRQTVIQAMVETFGNWSSREAPRV